MIDYRGWSKASILRYYLKGVEGSGLFNENTIEIFKDNFELVFDCYRQHGELTNDDLDSFNCLISMLSRKYKRIQDANRFVDFTVERYMDLMEYYRKIHIVNPKKDPCAETLSRIMDEILEIVDG